MKTDGLAGFGKTTARRCAVLALLALAGCAAQPQVQMSDQSLERELDAKLAQTLRKADLVLQEMLSIEIGTKAAARRDIEGQPTSMLAHKLRSSFPISWQVGSAEILLEQIATAINAEFYVVNGTGVVPMVTLHQDQYGTYQSALESLAQQLGSVADIAVISGRVPRIELRYFKAR